jgi:hypothetical protein
MATQTITRMAINSTDGTLGMNEYQFKKYFIVTLSHKYSIKPTFLTENSGPFYTPHHHI